MCIKGTGQVGIVLPGIGKTCTNFLKRESLAKTFIRAKVAWENNRKFSGPNACKCHPS